VGDIEGLTLGGLFDELEEVAAELGDGDLHGSILAHDVHSVMYVKYISESLLGVKVISEPVQKCVAFCRERGYGFIEHVQIS
jgi:hypothetical protein